jgi:hypothetical protein
MTVIKSKPEFASELVCIIPYAYWLHKQGKLESVHTSKDMKPFYYFCNDVKEQYDDRTVDYNFSGMKEVPNPWIHHNGSKDGVLDYSQWTPPPYAEQYKTEEFDDLKPYIIVNNNYNIEYGRDITESLRYFNILALHDIFSYLVDSGYNVIYKRPNNTEFTLDQNEMQTLHEGHDLTAEIDGMGTVSDYDLCDYFNNVKNINEITSLHSYNELQLRLFSGAEGFVTTNGGGGVLCSYFNKPVVMHVPHGKELRDGYLTDEDSYINKLSNNKVYPILDEGNQSNYKKVIEKIKEVF